MENKTAIKEKYILDVIKHCSMEIDRANCIGTRSYVIQEFVKQSIVVCIALLESVYGTTTSKRQIIKFLQDVGFVNGRECARRYKMTKSTMHIFLKRFVVNHPNRVIEYNKRKYYSLPLIKEL